MSSRILSRLRSSAAADHMRHLNQAERAVRLDYLVRKPLSMPPVPYNPFSRVPCQPHIYSVHSQKCVPLKNTVSGAMDPGGVLKVVSWNLYHSGPDPGSHASAALDHLQELFGDDPGPLAVMLQELCDHSFRSIQENKWIQRNFVLSDIKPPQSIYTEIAGETFIPHQLQWRAAPYFTMMMTARHLGVLDCFRAPFVGIIGRCALVVDIPVLADSKNALRLCTTHLESLFDPWSRHGQIRLVSSILKHRAEKYNIVGGLVGGDMNTMDKSKQEFHKGSDIDLKDVWEDVPAPPIPVRPFVKDTTYGKARGNTWGYQTDKVQSSKKGKRLDKFFYTGRIKTVPVNESQDVTGNLGRLGIGVMTEVVCWQREWPELAVRRRRLVPVTRKAYCSEEYAAELAGQGKNVARKRVTTWASDHFGIAVGVRV